MFDLKVAKTKLALAQEKLSMHEFEFAKKHAAPQNVNVTV